MIAHHVHDALEQVDRLRELILDRRRFRGYSGHARIASGFAALAGAGALASGRVPAEPAAHLLAWGVVLAVALCANYGALAWWFFSDPAKRRDLLSLRPAVDAIPTLAAGAVLSGALIRAGALDLLPGAWMLAYGLAHTTSRLSLPPANYALGLAYLAAGAALLLAGVPFLNPWPMGLVFFAGESLGGWIFLRDERRARRGEER